MREINAFLLVDMLNKLLVKKAVITKSTSPESLRNFIKRLYPFEFDKGLIRFGPNGDGGYLVPNDLYIDNTSKKSIVLPKQWYKL